MCIYMYGKIKTKPELNRNWTKPSPNSCRTESSLDLEVSGFTLECFA